MVVAGPDEEPVVDPELTFGVDPTTLKVFVERASVSPEQAVPLFF